MILIQKHKIVIGILSALLIVASVSIYRYANANNKRVGTESFATQSTILNPGVNNTRITQSVRSVPAVVGIDMQFALNLADDRILMGASHNVFVGKVINEIGVEEVQANPRLTIPITQFVVTVVSNIKGNLSGSVTVNQVGGYKNGVLYAIQGGDAAGLNNEAGGYLLQPGETYLFATRYDNGTYDLWSYPTALTLISQDSALSTNQLLAAAEDNLRVEQLRITYPKEILWSFDVRDQNTKNSHQSLQISPVVPTSTATTSSISTTTQSY